MDDCIFCKIVKGEIPSTKTLDTKRFVGFLTIEPKGPKHTLIIPKAHYRWFYDLPEDLHAELFSIAKEHAISLKKETGTDYVKLLLDGRDVPHVHLHLIPSNL
jgi:histidine triad (HIT) family protein